MLHLFVFLQKTRAMVNKRWYIVFILCVGFLSGCTKETLCIVEGSLPGKEYDGETIYLVPFTKRGEFRIDSVQIQNGTFTIKREIGEDDICILRARPLLRLSLQELLVVIEPGHVKVNIGSTSSASGAPLNDELQRWKENKELTDQFRRQALTELNSKKDTAWYDQRIQDLHEVSLNYNIQFVERNKDNKLGRFVYSMIRHQLTPEQDKTFAISE